MKSHATDLRWAALSLNFLDVEGVSFGDGFWAQAEELDIWGSLPMIDTLGFDVIEHETRMDFLNRGLLT